MSTSTFKKQGCIATGHGDIDHDGYIKTDLRGSDFRIIA
jgi:hypothetical protein